jgi:hypothetical protein
MALVLLALAVLATAAVARRDIVGDVWIPVPWAILGAGFGALWAGFIANVAVDRLIRFLAERDAARAAAQAKAECDELDKLLVAMEVPTAGR